MASSVDLGNRLEGIVVSLVKSGRYNSRSEVLREGVRLIHERETRLAALDASISRGIADAEAGRVHDLDAVAKALDAKFTAIATPTCHCERRDQATPKRSSGFAQARAIHESYSYQSLIHDA